MEIKSFEIKSTYDELPLKGVIYEPSQEMERKGLIHILHGKSEFKERYQEFMRFLCENGYVVACHDHRGHGDSVAREEDRGWFGDSNAEAVVTDAITVTETLKKQYPNMPTILLGHSMGSMIARCYIQKHDHLIDKLIVCGTPNQNALVGFAICLTKGIALFRGARHRSKFLDYCATGKGDKNFPGEGKGAWLSANRENIDAFYSSHKAGFVFTCNGFENLFKLLRNTYKARRYKVSNPNLPIHFISGEKDPVKGSVLDWSRAVDFMTELGYKNVTAALYDGLRHEILNEPSRQKVYDDVLAFIEDRLEIFEDEE